MLFSSISFLYYFLPAVLLLYFVVPVRLKNPILLLASLLFYAWGEPRFTIIMLTTALTGYGAGLVLDRLQGRGRPAALSAGLFLTAAPLLLFKYGDFFIQNLNSLTQSSIASLGLVLPIGVSFYSFQILSYLLDVYRKEVEVERNPLHFLLYVSLFPQLIAGPIVRFKTVQEEIRERRVSLDLFASGASRFTVGLGKKVLLANNLAELGLNLGSQGGQSVLSLWLLALAFSLQIYFDFSGYSDMAIGLGRIFGFHFQENFIYPYISRSLTEFWRRWHISLGSWFRDYIYIPLGGSRGTLAKTVRNLLIVWLLTGLWHGAAWTFVFWGLFHFLLLALERAGLGKLLDKLPAFISIPATFLQVTVGFVLFKAENFLEAWESIRGMFGLLSLPLSDPLSIYYAKAFTLTLLIALVAATPLPKRIFDRVRDGQAGLLPDLATATGILLVLVLSTGSLINGSFNPFLYFRF